MEEKFTNRERALAGIARHLDTNIESREFDSQLESLSDDEREQLERVRAAVGFINGALGDDQLDVDTQTIAEQKTLGPDDTSDGGTIDQGPGKVGRFELIEMVGRGGFASVWSAHDPHLDRRVAIKILSQPGFESAEVTSRFHREAKAAAVLSHPNIVPVFDFGVDENQRFIASAFCDGQDLEHWLTRHQSVDFQLAATIVSKLAEAVEHAHQRGIIHRDLKPGNIMLKNLPVDCSPIEMADALRITDFGLAKNLESADPLQTREGAIVGTPAYMSPEQADGHKDIDARTDVYSLGAILYRLLTGKVPHQGKTHLDTLLSVRQNEPIALRKLKPEIPKNLEAICRKSLNKNPDRRYTTAHELSADLSRWLNGEVVAAKSSTVAERFGKWCKRNSLLAASILAITSALTVAVWQWSVKQKNLTIAHQQTIRAEKYLDEMTGIIDGLLEDIEKEPDSISTAQRNALVKIMRVQENLIEEESEDFSIQVNRLRAYRRMAKIQQTLGNFKEADETYSKAAVWLATSSDWTIPEDHPQLKLFAEQSFEFHMDYTKNLVGTGDFKLALESTRNAEAVVDEYEYLLTEIERYRFEIHYQVDRGAVFKQMQKYEEAAEWYHKAITIGEQLEAVETPLTHESSIVVTSSILNLAQLYNVMEMPTEAVELFELASGKIETAIQNAPDSIQLQRLRMVCDSNWSNSLVILNQYEKVQPVLQRVLENVEGLLDHDPTNHRAQISLVITYGKISNFYKKSKQFEKGLEATEQALAVAEGIETSLLGSETMLRTIDRQCSHLNSLQRNEEMLTACNEGIEFADQMIEEFPDTISGLVLRAKLYFKLMLAFKRLGHFEEFRERIDECFAAYEIAIKTTRDANDLRVLRLAVPMLHRFKAVVCGDLNDWDAAMENAERILENPNSDTKTKYFEAIRTLNEIMTHWEEKNGDAPDKYSAAREVAENWLELWLSSTEQPSVRQLKILRRFKMLQGNERWGKLLETASTPARTEF